MGLLSGVMTVEMSVLAKGEPTEIGLVLLMEAAWAWLLEETTGCRSAELSVLRLDEPTEIVLVLLWSASEHRMVSMFWAPKSAQSRRPLEQPLVLVSKSVLPTGPDCSRTIVSNTWIRARTSQKSLCGGNR